MMLDGNDKQSAGEPIKWENFAKFVRQLSHDLRNQLNAAELQAALIGELAREPELKPELLRLRELVSKLGVTLQQLSASVAPPRPTLLPYGAADFVSDLQQSMARDFPQQSFKWEVEVDSATLNIDPSLIGWTMKELVDNAVRHGATGEIEMKVSTQGSELICSIVEKKANAVDPKQWRDLLAKVAHGHYGLGLRRAREIIAAHGGTLTSEFDPASSTLTSRIVLPCSSAATQSAG
ncbi:MAG: hypothetical protein JO354_01105 [Verrucomicrobia bacterium]|nr:hypothetical protein [Verrucomicrobiota bacterium]